MVIAISSPPQLDAVQKLFLGHPSTKTSRELESLQRIMVDDQRCGIIMKNSMTISLEWPISLRKAKTEWEWMK